MRRFVPFALLLVLGACTTTQIVSTGGAAAVAPMLSVERFLQAANTRDLHAMGSLFGTEDGPIIETGGAFGCAFKRMGSWIGIGMPCRTLQEVELHMDAIAEILRHEDYTIRSENSVAGRLNPTSRIMVDITIQGRTYTAVPFVVVRTGEGRWLVEEIGLGRITGG